VNVRNSLPATVDFNSLAAFKRTAKRADMSAFLSCNCTRCVLFIAFMFYIVYSCHDSTVLCHITVLWTSGQLLVFLSDLAVLLF